MERQNKRMSWTLCPYCKMRIYIHRKNSHTCDLYEVMKIRGIIKNENEKHIAKI
jgi:hypothetical protein